MPYSWGAALFHAVGGSALVSRIRTIDFALLKPYFQGTTTRIGAPFWFGRTWPYMPTVRSVNGWSASSSRSPSVYGQSSANRSEEHTSELQSRLHLVCRLLLEKKKQKTSLMII